MIKGENKINHSIVTGYHDMLQRHAVAGRGGLATFK